MSMPFSEGVSPRDVARATADGGKFHDVVVAASKVMHGVEIDPADAAALRWARDLLKVASSKDVVFAMPSAQQLSGPGSTILALRRAADPALGDPEQGLVELRRRLDGVLKGERDETAVQAMGSLRQLFSMVSRFFLRAEIATQSERPESLWALSPTSSRL